MDSLEGVCGFSFLYFPLFCFCITTIIYLSKAFVSTILFVYGDEEFGDDEWDQSNGLEIGA